MNRKKALLTIAAAGIILLMILLINLSIKKNGAGNSSGALKAIEPKLDTEDTMTRDSLMKTAEPEPEREPPIHGKEPLLR